MVNLIFIIVFFLLSSITPVYAAAFNDAATGNWNVGTTWGGACASSCVEGTDYPGSSDTVTINSHSVTMTANHNASAFTMATGGTLNMSTNTLTIVGNLTITGGTLNFSAGAVIKMIGDNDNTADSFTVTTTSTQLPYFTIDGAEDQGSPYTQWDTWTLQDHLTAWRITLTDGKISDNAKTVTINDPTAITSTAILTATANSSIMSSSTGSWVIAVDGYASTAYSGILYNQITINSGKTFGGLGLKMKKLILQDNATLNVWDNNYVNASTNDQIVLGVGSAIVSSGDDSIWLSAQVATVTQGAMDIDASIGLGGPSGGTIRMTNNWETNENLYCQGFQNATATKTQAMLFDTDTYNLNVGGQFYIAGNNIYHCKYTLGQGVHSIGTNLSCTVGNHGANYGSWIDFESSTVTIGGNLDLTDIEPNFNTALISVAGNIDFTYVKSDAYATSGVSVGTSTITLNGTADQTITAANVNTNAGGQIQEFYNLTLNNTGASGSDDIIIAWDASRPLDIANNLTITNGNLDLDTNDPTVNVTGAVSVGASGSLAVGTSTVTLSGASASYTDADITQANTTWGSGSTLNVQSNLTQTLPAGETYGNLQLGAYSTTLAVTMGGTIAGNLTIDSDATVELNEDTVVNGNVTINGTLNTNGYELNVDGNITISGTLNATSDVENDGSTINVGGTWTKSGTFTADDSTVIFDGTSQSVSGSSTFYNLTKDTTSADTLTFESGATQTIASGGTITLKGRSGNLLTVTASAPATKAIITVTNPGATSDVDYVSPSYIDASGGSAIVPTNTSDGSPAGTNFNWTFAGVTTLTWSGAGGDNNWSTAANWAGVAPSGGENLVFPTGASRKATMNNDIAASTSFNTLTIEDTGYTIAGNAIAMDGAVTDSSSGGTNTISLNIAFGVVTPITVTNSNQTLAITGIISGAGGVIKSGGGTLTLSGTNTYTNTTTIEAGTLSLGASVPSGSAGALGNASSTILLGATAGSADAALYTNGAYTIARAINVRAGSSGTSYIGGSSAHSSSYTGNITLNKALLVSAATSGTVSLSTGVVSGSYGLTKTGAGSLTLSGTNTYTGTTTIKAGTVYVGANAPSGSAGALGNASSAVLLGDTSGSADASLLTNGAFTVGRAVTVQAGSSGVAYLGSSTSDNATFSGNITLNKAITLSAASSSNVTLSGVISGAFDVTKADAGTVTYAGVNTYSGTTTLAAGTLAGSGTLYTNGPLAVTNSAATTLDLTNDTAFFGGDVNLTNLDTFTTTGSTVMLKSTASTSLTTAGKSFNNLTINDGLLAYWKLDETAEGNCASGDGKDACDASGYANHGEWITTPAASSDVSSSISFTNTGSINLQGSEYIEIPDTQVLRFTDGSGNDQPFSVAGWFKNTDGSPFIIDKEDASEGFEILVQSGNFEVFLVQGGFSEYLYWYDSSSFNTALWHHVAFTYDGSETWAGGKLYIDGVEIVMTDFSSGGYTGTAGTSETLKIGYSVYNGSYTNGLVDEVRIYNRVLTPTEITRLAAGGQPQTGTATITLQDALTVSGNLVNNSGTLDVKSGSNYAVNVGGNWENNGGIFTARSGTVTLNGSSSQSMLSGGQAFNNLTIANANTVTFLDPWTTVNFTDTTPGSQLLFKPGATYTLSGTLSLSSGGSNISLDTTTSAAPAFIFDVTGGAQAVSKVTVANSNVSSNNITATVSTNSGGNDDGAAAPHWIFSSMVATDAMTFGVEF